MRARARAVSVIVTRPALPTTVVTTTLLLLLYYYYYSSGSFIKLKIFGIISVRPSSEGIKLSQGFMDWNCSPEKIIHHELTSLANVCVF